MSPSVSVVIACKGIGEYERDCVRRCLALKGVDIELLLLPDYEGDSGLEDSRMRVLATGPVKPSRGGSHASVLA